MGPRVGVVLAVVLAPALATCGKGAPTVSPDPRGLLENPEAGYRLSYPGDWHVAEQLVATDFARDGRCQSVEVVDSAPPAQAGPGAVLLHSFVQVCWRPRADGASLDEFMRSRYGSVLERFEKTMLAGVAAYRARREGAGEQYVLQTDAERFEVVSGVTAEPSRIASREEETRDVIASFQLDQRR